MFEMGKKGGPDKPADTMQRQDTAPARVDSVAARSGTSGGHAVIGASIHIDGDVRGEEDLLIEGEVNGTVQLKNNSLTIGPQGKVRADVYAHSVYVDGYLEGDLYGSERVHIRKSAQVRGNVTSPRVSLEDGAKFKGSIEMDPQAVQASGASRNQQGKPSAAASNNGKPAAPTPSPQKFDGPAKPEAAAVKSAS
jgi:cytoskeletal protein CcmA (bactofilin family)